jgi:hypothetical protein
MGVANNFNLHDISGYQFFLEEFTETAEDADRFDEHRAEVQEGVDSLLTATTEDAAREALAHLNQFMGAEPFDAEEVVRNANNDELPHEYASRLENLLLHRGGGNDTSNTDPVI